MLRSVEAPLLPCVSDRQENWLPHVEADSVEETCAIPTTARLAKTARNPAVKGTRRKAKRSQRRVSKVVERKANDNNVVSFANLKGHREVSLQGHRARGRTVPKPSRNRPIVLARCLRPEHEMATARQHRKVSAAESPLCLPLTPNHVASISLPAP
jgi:hypothetical protein